MLTLLPLSPSKDRKKVIKKVTKIVFKKVANTIKVNQWRNHVYTILVKVAYTEREIMYCKV